MECRGIFFRSNYKYDNVQVTRWSNETFTSVSAILNKLQDAPKKSFLPSTSYNYNAKFGTISLI